VLIFQQHKPEIVNNDPFQPWSWSSSVSCVPDYRLSDNVIFREFTIRSLMDDPALFVLSVVEDRALRRRTDLPSWVPDFGTRISHCPLRFPNLDVDIPYCAGGDEKPMLQWSDDEPNAIRVPAFEIDTIRSVTTAGISVNETVVEATKLVQSCGKGPRRRKINFDAFWRTLIANSVGESQCEYPAPHSYSAAFTTFQATCGDPMWAEGMVFGEYLEKMKAMTPISLAAKRVLQGRRFFVTHKGHFGVGPMSCEAGDVVCVFRGGALPYVVRLEENGNEVCNGRTVGSFMFLGECYCHGFMEGQAMKMNAFKWEEIRLV
jgi:hypothetical protein